MATAPYFAGREASLMVGPTSAAPVEFGKVTNWRFFANHATIPVTNFDSSGWEQVISGTRNWGLTAETLMLSTVGSTTHADLRDLLSSGIRQWYKVSNTSTSGTAGFNFMGYGYVEDWDASGEEAGPQIQNFSIKGDGAYTESST